jgi:carboxypeptidase Taq
MLILNNINCDIKMTISYTALEKQISKISKIGSATSSLHWDLTQNTPDGSKDSISEVIGNLSALSHELFTSEEVNNLINSSEQEKLDEWQKANLDLIRKDYIHSTSLSTDFVEKFSIVSSKSQSVWQKAKAASDWDAFLPHLKEVVKYTKEMATVKSQKLNILPYEALLDQYDRGRTVREIISVFSTLRNNLPELISEIIEHQKTNQPLSITNSIDPKLQKEISIKIMQHMQFDFNNGRIDEYEHPYCIHTAGGVRILSKFKPDNFLEGIMATIHETGHALYEQNLPKEYKHQPIGGACGMSVHESQSLFMELQVARSREFTEFFAKILRDDFKFTGEEFKADNLYKLLNRVNRSLIRVNADEITYPLHVILRFEIEIGLLDDTIKVDEIPSIWNEKMKEYLGIVPENHKTGCMQDVHWSSGGFGYFPCYVGGSINASMLAKTARAQNTLRAEDLKNGDFTNIIGFLKKNIWSCGSRYTPSKLVEKTTNLSTLEPEVFLNYLREKFLRG